MDERDPNADFEKLKGLSTEELKRLRRLRVPVETILYEVAEPVLGRMSDESEALASALLARIPLVWEHATMRRESSEEDFDLHVLMPSRSGKPTANLEISFDDDRALVLSFGNHVEEIYEELLHDESSKSLDERAFDEVASRMVVDRVESILDDRLLLLCGRRGLVPIAVLEDDLADALRTPLWNRRRNVRIRSWSGAKDRNVHVHDLKRELGVE